MPKPLPKPLPEPELDEIDIIPMRTEVCVFGGTAAGVIAAAAISKAGYPVLLVEPGRHLGGEGGKIFGGRSRGAEIVVIFPGQDRGGGFGDRVGSGAAALGVLGAEGSGLVGVGVPAFGADLLWYGHIGGVCSALGDEGGAAEGLVGGQSDGH